MKLDDFATTGLEPLLLVVLVEAFWTAPEVDPDFFTFDTSPGLLATFFDGCSLALSAER